MIAELSRVRASWMKHTPSLPHGGVGEAELVPCLGRAVNSRGAPDSGAAAYRSRRRPVRSGAFSTSSGDSVGASFCDGGGDTAGSGSGSGSVAKGGDGGTGRVERALEDPSPTLAEWLQRGPYVLSMAPSFFGFYGYLGALVALEDAGLLDKVCLATGASAGAMITGFFSAGLSAKDMREQVLKYRRSDFWDPPGLGGFLRGKKYEDILSGALPEGVRDFEHCRVPLAVSAFDMLRFKTRVLSEGRLSPALRASSTFPILFTPVWHPRGVLVDGGIQDTIGTWCIPSKAHRQRVLNVTIGKESNWWTSVPPSRAPGPADVRAKRPMELVSLALKDLPRPNPFAMERGGDALEAARSQVAAVLGERLRPGEEDAHWIAPTAGMAEIGTRGGGTQRKEATAPAAVNPGEREPLIPGRDNDSRRALVGPDKRVRCRPNPSG